MPPPATPLAGAALGHQWATVLHDRPAVHSSSTPGVSHMYAARDPVYSRVFAPLTGDEASILAGAEHHLPYLWGLTQEQRLTQSTAAAWEGNPPRRPCPNTTMP